MESTLGEDAVKIIGMMTKNLEYYINLVNKVVTGLKRIDSSVERNSIVVKVLSNSIIYYRKIVH